jgi:hypothetical protein
MSTTSLKAKLGGVKSAFEESDKNIKTSAGTAGGRPQ